MAKHLAGLNLPRTQVVLSGTMTPVTDHCAARGRTDFDTDTATMTSALLRMLLAGGPWTRPSSRTTEACTNGGCTIGTCGPF